MIAPKEGEVRGPDCVLYSGGILGRIVVFIDCDLGWIG